LHSGDSCACRACGPGHLVTLPTAFHCMTQKEVHKELTEARWSSYRDMGTELQKLRETQPQLP